MSHSKQGIKQVMKTKYHMEGSVNGHEFTIEGVGTGNPYEGKQMSELVIIKPAGKPLPFSFDILSSVFQYASQSTLKACLTISSKDSQMECHMKGHLCLRMEELLQPVGPFGGGYHRCQFDSTFKTEKPVTMPPNHVIEHHIARTDLGQTAKGFAVKLDGQAAAHVNPLKVE
ncbi:GFP-like fluorescent chromoprotein FP538 [Acropora cervicornis]|uniref:GFP-like fluorescent chromoprotein FP538 n=1 Tax=Acropora cervicornis TaxID=6130 RepID=A0AAD9V740_ACRCE|nr:GFP-like fluorescent chromoprotein FP538 [Acropora cervicornis]